MKEIARIVSGLIALRIVEDNGLNRCEKFESGNWIEFSRIGTPPVSFNIELKKWLEEYHPIKAKETRKPTNYTKSKEQPKRKTSSMPKN